MDDGKPTQSEFDSVVQFVDIYATLSASKFLDNDFMRLSFAMGKEGGENVFHAGLTGDDVLHDFVLPFRLIWSEGEPSCYSQVASILRKYAANPDAIKSQQKGINSAASESEQLVFISVDMSRREVINLYLNARYFHQGADSKRPYNRELLRQKEREHGPEKMEYNFHFALLMVVGAMQTLAEAARSALLSWYASFHMVPSDPMRSVALVDWPWADEVKLPRIDRSTPGWFVVEGPRERICRLIARGAFQNLQRLAEALAMSPEALAPLALDAPNCRSLLTAVGCTEWDEVHSVDLHSHPPPWGHLHGVSDWTCDEKGFIAVREDGHIGFTGDAMAICNRELLALVEAAAREPEPKTIFPNSPSFWAWR